VYSNICPTRCNVTQFIYIWKLLYMFRVVPPSIIRSAYNCIYSFWYLSHRYCYLPLTAGSSNGFKRSDDTFRLSYSIACDCSIRLFLDLFHSWLYIFHLSRFSGYGLVFSFLQVSSESLFLVVALFHSLDITIPNKLFPGYVILLHCVKTNKDCQLCISCRASELDPVSKFEF
jgi:hypothetical protein